VLRQRRGRMGGALWGALWARGRAVRAIRAMRAPARPPDPLRTSPGTHAPDPRRRDCRDTAVLHIRPPAKRRTGTADGASAPRLIQTACNLNFGLWLHSKNKNSVLGNGFGIETKTGVVRIFCIFQARPTFSHIIQTVLARPFN